ncbi:hypothetical protein K491DRAFT_327926 [Lophiostoma macrostomum CBS 122681]|uniref:Uncharacterized protein n=1 Tax=Lophiostoma macrostomum CBS 122681 TaxID=1314788 RepID=A0A6A6TCD2_9PLEO|nr:hypothetical protein K491DRAFT_327926 [Lophiostoma macrostomum CBS 122681]
MQPRLHQLFQTSVSLQQKHLYQTREFSLHYQNVKMSKEDQDLNLHERANLLFEVWCTIEGVSQDFEKALAIDGPTDPKLEAWNELMEALRKGSRNLHAQVEFHRCLGCGTKYPWQVRLDDGGYTAWVGWLCQIAYYWDISGQAIRDGVYKKSKNHVFEQQYNAVKTLDIKWHDPPPPPEGRNTPITEPPNVPQRE